MTGLLQRLIMTVSLQKRYMNSFLQKNMKNSNKFKASFITIKVKKIIEMKGKRTIHLQIIIF